MPSTAREVASRLIARESSAAPDSNAAAIAASALERLSEDLARFIGTDGSHALLVRARSQAQAAHPALKNINIIAQPLSVQGVPESIEASGVAPIAVGLESTLAALIALLARLIGDELAMKLVSQNPLDNELPDGQKGEE